MKIVFQQVFYVNNNFEYMRYKLDLSLYNFHLYVCDSNWFNLCLNLRMKTYLFFTYDIHYHKVILGSLHKIFMNKCIHQTLSCMKDIH